MFCDRNLQWRKLQARARRLEATGSENTSGQEQAQSIEGKKPASFANDFST